MTIVDTDVHPLPVSGEVLKSYAPPEWKDKLWPTGNAVSPMSYFYDTPDCLQDELTARRRQSRPAGEPRAAIRSSPPSSCWSTRV